MHISFDPNTKWMADDPAIPVGRRAAARLRLSIPARLVTLCDTRRCILVNLSRTGAQVGLEKPLGEGEGVVLQIAGIDQFGDVVRCAVGSSGGINGIEFESGLTDSEVLALRHFADSFAGEENRQLRNEVRTWVAGSN